MTTHLIAELTLFALFVAANLAFVITFRRLSALRRNAYLTDHDGIRCRYAKVAQAIREGAER